MREMNVNTVILFPLLLSAANFFVTGTSDDYTDHQTEEEIIKNVQKHSYTLKRTKDPRDKRALGVVLQGLVGALGYVPSPIQFGTLPVNNASSNGSYTGLIGQVPAITSTTEPPITYPPGSTIPLTVQPIPSLTYPPDLVNRASNQPSSPRPSAQPPSCQFSMDVPKPLPPGSFVPQVSSTPGKPFAPTSCPPTNRETLKLTGFINFGNTSDPLGHLQQYERLFHGPLNVTTPVPSPLSTTPLPQNSQSTLLPPFLVRIPLPLAPELLPKRLSAPKRISSNFEKGYVKSSDSENYNVERKEKKEPEGLRIGPDISDDDEYKTEEHQYVTEKQIEKAEDVEDDEVQEKDVKEEQDDGSEENAEENEESSKQNQEEESEEGREGSEENSENLEHRTDDGASDEEVDVKHRMYEEITPSRQKEGHIYSFEKLPVSLDRENAKPDGIIRNSYGQSLENDGSDERVSSYFPMFKNPQMNQRFDSDAPSVDQGSKSEYEDYESDNVENQSSDYEDEDAESTKSSDVGRKHNEKLSIEVVSRNNNDQQVNFQTPRKLAKFRDETIENEHVAHKVENVSKIETSEPFNFLKHVPYYVSVRNRYEPIDYQKISQKNQESVVNSRIHSPEYFEKKNFLRATVVSPSENIHEKLYRETVKEFRVSPPPSDHSFGGTKQLFVSSKQNEDDSIRNPVDPPWNMRNLHFRMIYPDGRIIENNFPRYQTSTIYHGNRENEPEFDVVSSRNYDSKNSFSPRPMRVGLHHENNERNNLHLQQKMSRNIDERENIRFDRKQKVPENVGIPTMQVIRERGNLIKKLSNYRMVPRTFDKNYESTNNAEIQNLYNLNKNKNVAMAENDEELVTVKTFIEARTTQPIDDYNPTSNEDFKKSEENVYASETRFVNMDSDEIDVKNFNGDDEIGKKTIPGEKYENPIYGVKYPEEKQLEPNGEIQITKFYRNL